MRKKKSVNCGQCGAECQWYHKGKRHRVLVCGNCGIIASNPLPLLGLVAGAVGRGVAKKAAGTVAATAVGSFIGKKLAGKDGGEEGVRRIEYDNKDVPNTWKREQWYLDEAMGRHRS